MCPTNSTPVDDNGDNDMSSMEGTPNQAIPLANPQEDVTQQDLDNIENILRLVGQQNTDPAHSSRYSLARSDTQSTPGTSVAASPTNDKHDNFIPIDAGLCKCLITGQKDGILATEANLDKYKSKDEKNSVLHIAASAGQDHLIADILPKCQGVITWANIKGDLAVHSAAKAGQLKALQSLISFDGFKREFLGRTNGEGNTVLHIALENDQKQMAKFLVDKYREASYQLNNEKVSPFYICIKSAHWELVKQMIIDIKQHKEAAEQTLLLGKSVVHAAIDAKNIEVLKDILNNLGYLINSLDDEGRTPLSYAAFKGFVEGVKYILVEFPESAFKCDKDEEGSFPIHKAASGGNIKVIKELRCTKQLLNRKDQNILHLAAASGRSNLVSYLLKLPELDGLISLKDEDGNTPLHLATKGFHPRVVYILTRDKRCRRELQKQNKDGLTALDVAEINAGSFPTFEARLTWMALRYVDAPRSSQSTRKKYVRENIIENQSNKVDDKKELEDYKDGVDTHLLVATLVATVTFAAGFTLPGGYYQDDDEKKDHKIGMAVLAKYWTFKVFVICNTAALYSSILSVVTLIWAYMGDLKLVLVSLRVALPLLGFALSMMSVAFMMGVFLVLEQAKKLSYMVLGMGSLFLFVVLVFFIPLYNPSYIRNSVVRFFFSGTFLLLLLVCEKSTIKYA